jgi:hypothetical protein
MFTRRPLMLAGVAFAAAGALAGTAVVASGQRAPAAVTKVHMVANGSQLAACMPGVHVDVTVNKTVDQVGFDTLSIKARKLPRNTVFTLFFLENATPPNVGAAQYIGDFTSDAMGNSHNTLRLIVAEAFATVNGANHIELNRLGAWFADPAADDFCLGAGSPVTTFDGDRSAGVQALNSGSASLPPP